MIFFFWTWLFAKGNQTKINGRGYAPAKKETAFSVETINKMKIKCKKYLANYISDTEVNDKI